MIRDQLAKIGQGATEQAAEDVVPSATKRRPFAPSPTLTVGILILSFWLACAVLGPTLVPFDPYADDILNATLPPNALHWFGTDALGRDVFSRVIVGSRAILTVAPIATLLGLVVGSALGLILGYVGGLVDALASRILEAFMALPVVVLALLMLVTLGASDLTVILMVGLLYAPLVAKTVRASVRAEKELDYVSAARLSGEGAVSIMVCEILLNIAQVILIEGIVRLGYAFFTVATLSFLGLGIQPPSTDWGLAIAENYGFLTSGMWWIVTFNAAAIVSLVIATNLIADGLGAFDG
ncbi:ABC transporter permease [Rhizobium multihospitium]|uniref:Peptide/nickel transport system permease protein n=1 Tax=Rhizobium multihospitium TaxID=410764 RepID=A0A1C3WWT9_9HYPH|nr:ABC transporter permease [Rhizobium multihospitium]SCB44204.1 peptide/nickel transport system permease protein [Rhizobium multihospitium]